MIYHCKTLRSFECYIVGGSIRDHLLRRYSKDCDIATPLHPKQLLELLPGSKMINAAQAYPIVTWMGFEIASFRKDGVSRADADGITLTATLEEDAQRRDFTMNALYMPLHTKRERGKEDLILDPTGFGRQDISNKVIRFVGDPDERIAEDPLRILRAYRFQAQLGFSFESETERALEDSLKLLTIRKQPVKKSELYLKYGSEEF